MSRDPDPALPGASSDLALDLVVEDGGWTAIASGDDGEAFVSETVQAALCGLRRQSGRAWPGPFELSVTLTGDRRMQQVNHAYRGQDKPTNVLSFPAWGADDLLRLAAGRPPAGHPPGLPLPLGDILLARETIAREAAEQGKNFRDHVRHLLVHAVLHLAGHDHIQDDDADIMEGLEVEILRSFNISDPYQTRGQSADRHD